MLKVYQLNSLYIFAPIIKGALKIYFEILLFTLSIFYSFLIKIYLLEINIFQIKFYYYKEKLYNLKNFDSNENYIVYLKYTLLSLMLIKVKIMLKSS